MAIKIDNITPLVELRSKAGLTREVAANILKITSMTLYRYEIGNFDVPLGIAEEMATLYQVPFDEIRAAVRDTKAMKDANSSGRIRAPKRQDISKNLENAKIRAMIKKAVEMAEKSKVAEPV